MGARRVARLLAALVIAALAGVTIGCRASSDAGAASVDAGADAPTAACPAGQVVLGAEGCATSGVPADACGEGFASDGAGGCAAILPPSPCGPGELALPGETVCHEVAPCGEGTWGDIPIEAGTVFVDRLFAGPDASDGTKDRPFRTITDAIAAAPDGAMIAIAAGNYVETPWATAKSLRFWGRCPGLVSITGTGPRGSTSPAFILGADGSEAHTLGLTGPTAPAAVSAASRVVLDRVWIHDTDGIGLLLVDAGVTMTRSLIETARVTALLFAGGKAVLDGVVIRDTRSTDASSAGLPPGEAGAGIDAQINPKNGDATDLTMRGCIVERNRGLGVSLAGATATIERTLVRDIYAQEADGSDGEGVAITYLSPTHPTATLRNLVVERAHLAGVVVMGADATVDAVTVRDTQPAARGSSTAGVGYGIAAQRDPASRSRSHVSVARSAITGSVVSGVFDADSDVTLDASLVRGTKPLADGSFGDGVLVLADHDAASATLTATRVATNARAGVSSFGAHVSLAAVDLDCNAIQLDGEPWGSRDFAFDDVGGNACACGATSTSTAPAGCAVATTQLVPPGGVQ